MGVEPLLGIGLAGGGDTDVNRGVTEWLSRIMAMLAGGGAVAE